MVIVVVISPDDTPSVLVRKSEMACFTWAFDDPSRTAIRPPSRAEFVTRLLTHIARPNSMIPSTTAMNTGSTRAISTAATPRRNAVPARFPAVRTISPPQICSGSGLTERSGQLLLNEPWRREIAVIGNSRAPANHKAGNKRGRLHGDVLVVSGELNVQDANGDEFGDG